ncbi:MAG: transposase, partial [Acidobacteriota bacterium]
EIRLMQEEIQASRPEEGRWRCPGALRQRVLETVEAYRAQGLSRKVLAKELGVSESTLLRWRRQSQAGFRPPRPISEMRGLIAELYEIEREVQGPFPGNPAAQKARHRLRRERSSVVLERIREAAFSHGGLRRSAFGKALRYLLAHWDRLTLFLEDPRIALDNTAAERVLRGPVVGRKNFYGNRSKRGARTAAILYSLIETAKLNGRDPRIYLRDAARTAIQRPGAVTLPF